MREGMIGLLHPGEMGATVGAAADVYKRLARFKDAPQPPPVEEAAAAVLGR